MKTKDLKQLREETISCNSRAFNSYNKQNYTLKEINEFMAKVALQEDASLYFPISACIHYSGKTWSVFITSPIHIRIS